MSTPTNLFINWSTVGYTPSGGSLASLNKVTSVKPSRNGQMEGFKGDVDQFFRVIAVPSQTRTIEVTTGDVKAALAIAIGSHGAFSAIFADAINGTTVGGGGITIALTNCVVTGNTAQGEHAKFGEATITFEGYASDGITDPLTVTAL